MKKSIKNLNYQKHDSIDQDLCFYCGCLGDSISHCPSLASLDFYPRFPRIVVKACSECEKTLIKPILPNLLTQIDFLIKIYRKKYKKYLNCAHWTEDELENLDGSLKIYVNVENIKIQTHHDRLEFLFLLKKQLIAQKSLTNQDD